MAEATSSELRNHDTSVPRDLPTGVVTLLFTDVEGSTKLLREVDDAYAEKLHEHRRVLRSAFAAHARISSAMPGVLALAPGLTMLIVTPVPSTSFAQTSVAISSAAFEAP